MATNGHGGARPGAGRKPRSNQVAPQAVQLGNADGAAALLTAAVYELAIGQSSVELALDSKGQAKPKVHVFHRDAKQASTIAQQLFDELVIKYVQAPTDLVKNAA